MPNSADLAQAARDAAGISQELPSDAGAGAGGQPSALDLMALLKSGQFSAASLIQLLQALLASGQLPGGGPMPGGDMSALMGQGSPVSPIEAAYLGGQQ